MSGRAFLDTNVLVYAVDGADVAKNTRAKALLRQSLLNEDGVVSGQILGEFFAVATRRLAVPLSVDEAQEVVDQLSALQVVGVDLPLVKRAIDLHKRYQVAYWDSLVVAAAERAQCARILSEDFNPGQEYVGIVAENPFANL